MTLSRLVFCGEPYRHLHLGAPALLPRIYCITPTPISVGRWRCQHAKAATSAPLTVHFTSKQVYASGDALFKSPLWQQILADALGVRIHFLSGEKQAAAKGAAVLAVSSLVCTREHVERVHARGRRAPDTVEPQLWPASAFELRTFMMCKGQ